MNTYSDLLPLQKALTDLLSFFNSFCLKNDIHYFLAFGTALGAFRHHGFIPWDDDIDVIMTISEYCKLMSCCKAQLSSKSQYYLDVEYTSKNNPMFCKFRKRGTTYIESKDSKFIDHNEIFLDVFVLYNTPNSQKERKKQFLRAKELTFLVSYKNRGHKHKLFSFFAYLFLEGFRKEIKHNILKYENKETSYYSTLFVYLPMNLFPKTIFLETTYLSFNGLQLPVPKKIEQFLTIMYGPKFNELPPESERKPHHIMYLNLDKELCKEDIKKIADKF
jgi:lipopolysaccharide cholinephosphotransferase